MGWRVTEKSVIPRDGARGTEDGVFVGDNCFAVLDGYSNRIPLRIGKNALSPGQYAVGAGLEVLRLIDPALERYPDRLLQALTIGVQNALSQVKWPDERRPGFVFVAFLPFFPAIIRVGDCSYLLDDRGDNRGLEVDRIKASVRAHMIGGYRERGIPDDALRVEDLSQPAMEAMLLQWQHRYCNSNDHALGYGAVDGRDIPGKWRERIPVPPRTSSVILASDGYPPKALRRTLEETEEELARLLERDPLCTTDIRGTRCPGPGEKRFDDCTYLHIERT